MAPSLLRHPGHLSPASALQLSQKATEVLRKSAGAVSSSPLGALLSGSETPELWIHHENLLLACLRTGDEPTARQCLERLVARFGADNERVMALGGLVKEAAAPDDSALEAVMRDYDEILAENNTNIPVAKRRIGLLRSMGRTPEAIRSLLQLLDFSPTDGEAWSELADAYMSQGLYAQAMYAMEEVLVLAPNAWNIHAKLGEMLFTAATAAGAKDEMVSRYLSESLRRFARSIELCDHYLRGYCGLKVVTARLLREPNSAMLKPVAAGDFCPPDRASVEKLAELATEKLAEIVRRYNAQERSWRGYDASEIAAARELLAQKE